ncbi:MAG: hypothetical protein ACP5N3_01165 [Candidatus Nanoarchaeia archaeon]
MAENRNTKVNEIIRTQKVEGGLDAEIIFGTSQSPSEIKAGETPEQHVEKYIGKINKFLRREDNTIDVAVTEDEAAVYGEISNAAVNLGAELNKYANDKIFSHILRAIKFLDDKKRIHYLGKFAHLAKQDAEVFVSESGSATSGRSYLLPIIYSNVINPVMDKYMSLKGCRGDSISKCITQDLDILLAKSEDAILSAKKKKVAGQSFDISELTYASFFNKKMWSDKMVLDLINSQDYKPRIDAVTSDGYSPIVSVEFSSKREEKGKKERFRVEVSIDGAHQTEMIKLSFQEGLSAGQKDAFEYLASKTRPRSNEDRIRTNRFVKMIYQL